MNFDDYDNHILQKYRLAVAIAIIKSTPDNSTPKSYLDALRKEITSKMESQDPDATICDDDFDFNDDEKLDYMVNDDNDKDIVDNNDNNESQCNDNQMNDSVTILKDFDFNEIMNNMNEGKSTRELMTNNSVTDVLRILKAVDNGQLSETEIACGNGININHSQSTYYGSSQSQLEPINISNSENIDQIRQSRQVVSDKFKNLQYDSNNVLHNKMCEIKANENLDYNATLYDTQENSNQHEYSDLTHVSQSQIDNVIVPRYLLEKKTQTNYNLGTSINKVQDSDIISVINKPGGNSNSHNNVFEITSKHIQGKINTETLICNVNTTNDNKKHKFSTQDVENVRIKRLRNDDDICYANTDKNSAYLNEIKSIYNLNAKAIELNLNNDIGPTDGTKNEFAKSEKISELNNDSLLNCTENESNLSKFRKETNIDKKNSLDNVGSQNSVASSNITYNLGFNSQTLSQFSQESYFQLSNNKPEVMINVNTHNSQEKIPKEREMEDIVFEEIKDSIHEEEDIIEEIFDKLTDSQTEIVPFKVLEELNKIKTFLSKRDRRNSSGCASDSGYKSDSQSRSSLRSGLCPDTWVNQSAHCLLGFERQCPLVAATEDIVNEISRTLGRLIDRLHEEEKYPSFIEEHLLAVDSLLNEIYEGEAKDQLLKKDENIYRLFLLNKSSHVIKYTIEKILSILEEVPKTLSEEEMLEITQTNKTENLSYIFHILETLLKKLIALKNFSSQQSTQNSQEDEGILKKSSLTEIWRKKWNSVKKSEEVPANIKLCVLARSSDVLNKMVVQAMDGYSLISYLALQCFNLLQT